MVAYPLITHASTRVGEARVTPSLAAVRNSETVKIPVSFFSQVVFYFAPGVDRARGLALELVKRPFPLPTSNLRTVANCNPRSEEILPLWT